MTETDRPKVAFISTRALETGEMTGRLHVAHAILRALEPSSTLVRLRLPSAVSDPGAGRACEAALAVAASAVCGPLLPLQCAIFASFRDRARLISSLPADLSAVYLDGVRGYALLAALRRRRPDLRIVVDMDDLMSRRMDLLLNVGEGLSPGYLARRLPGLLRGLLRLKPLGALLLVYERATLRRVERRVCGLADAVVLLSQPDADALRAFAGGGRAEIVRVPPPWAPAPERRPFLRPQRFVFVGSDVLTQNRMSIDYLVGLWRRHAVSAPLVLYGRHARALAPTPGVTVAGYAESLTDIYDGRSVLLAPAKIGGGVKTKVLEAFAQGAPVIGNRLTFESIPVGAGYPLLIEDEAALVGLLQQPERHQARFDRAVRDGLDCLAEHHDPAQFERRWRRLLAPTRGAARTAASRAPQAAFGLEAFAVPAGPGPWADAEAAAPGPTQDWARAEAARPAAAIDAFTTLDPANDAPEAG